VEKNVTDTTKKINLKRITLLTGGILLGCLVLTIAFLYMKSYDIQYELKTFSQYWDESNMTECFSVQGTHISMKIPENVVNTELLLWMKEMPLPSRYKVKNVQLDASSKRINMNGSLYGINVPLSMTFDPVVQEGKIIINFSQLIIGQSVKLKETSSQKLMGFLFQNNLPIVFDGKSLFHSNILKIEQLDWVADNFSLSAKINESLLRTELGIIKSGANNEILTKFASSNIEAEKQAANYINNLDQITEDDLVKIINDVLSNGELTRNILMIAEPNIAKKAFDNYGKGFKNIEFNEIKDARKAILNEQLKPYRKSLYDALNMLYFSVEPMHINKGQLYSVAKKQYLTPQSIAIEEGVIIPEMTLKRLSFFYEKDNGLLLLAYQLNEDEYLVMYEDQFKTLSKTDYEEGTSYEDTGRVSSVNDKATWDSLYNQMKIYFQDEAVFIRYMKADEQYAFVVASPTYNYQNFKAIAFEKTEGEWVILEEDIQNITDLNKAHPEFNLETATMEVEKVKIYQLNEEMYDVILEDMMDKGIIKSKEDLLITYCSYGNDYIAFSLSDGNEYVYKVYSLYLHTVYDKETAEETWIDLPEIITLQDPPA